MGTTLGSTRIRHTDFLFQHHEEFAAGTAAFLDAA